jgi:hypothetical protein
MAVENTRAFVRPFCRIFEGVFWGALYWGLGTRAAGQELVLVAFLLCVFWVLVRGTNAAILKSALGLAYLPSEFLLFGYCLLVFAFVLARSALKSPTSMYLSRPGSVLGLLGVWAAISYLVSQFGIELNLLSLPLFFVTFFACTILFGVAADTRNREEFRGEICRFFVVITTIQACLVFYQARGLMLRSFTEGNLISARLWYVLESDSTLGSVDYQNGLVFALLFAATLLFGAPGRSGRKRSVIDLTKISALFLIVSAYLASSKSVFICWMVGWALAFVYLPVRSPLRTGRFPKRALRSLLAGGAAVLVILTVVMQGYGFQSIQRSLLSSVQGHKAIFFKRSVTEIHQARATWLTGTGPGTVGTRAANIRATDTLYKVKTLLPSWIEPFTSAPAKRHFVDLYQSDFATSRQYYSAMLTLPFSSLISLWVELGVPGMAIAVLFLVSVLKASGRVVHKSDCESDSRIAFAASAACLALAGLGWLDTVFERPTLMVVFWTFSGLAVSASRGYTKSKLAVNP